MNGPPFEKHVSYDGIRAHIRIPEQPTGLTFIAPGAGVQMDSSLIQAIRRTAEERGRAVVTVDIGGLPVPRDRLYVDAHIAFVPPLKSVLDGYLSGEDYVPEDFEVIAHSMGAAASLQLASDYPVSNLILLDPVRINHNYIGDLTCPVHFVLSNVRSFRASGQNMYRDLGDSIPKSKHLVETSADRASGHMFEGQEGEVRRVIDSLLIDVDHPDVDVAPRSVYKPDGLD